MTSDAERDEWVKRKTGVDPDTRCRRCRITARDSVKRGPFPTGINHPEYCETYSFYLYDQGKETAHHMCPPCHKEAELESLFALMDARDKRKDSKHDTNRTNGRLLAGGIPA